MEIKKPCLMVKYENVLKIKTYSFAGILTFLRKRYICKLKHSTTKHLTDEPEHKFYKICVERV